MQRLSRILALLFLLLPLASQAQQLNPGDYIYPILEVQGLYSANFGEMRPNHFHSGIDIKTDGTEGKPLVAVANGYVSRISVSPTGYGRALYITLDNGFTAVYGHISHFRDDIEEYVRKERLRQQKNRIDLSPAADRFRVLQGDRIAFSGNTGTSFGPHLHYELRASATQRTLNTVRQGIFRPQDDIPPYIMRVHYIETDTVRGVPVHRKPTSFDVEKVDKNTFRLSRRNPVEIGSNGHFVVEATDRRNGVSNTFGLYRATLLQDGERLFEYRMEGFTFDHSRDCNAASYYPLQLSSRNEVIRLAAIEGVYTNSYFCQEPSDEPATSNIPRARGAISVAEGEIHTIRIEAEDDCGNTSHIEFKVCGHIPWRAEADTLAVVCDRRRTTVLTTEGAQLTVPSGALYESLLLRIGRSDTRPARDTTLTVLTPVYRLLDRTTPLKRAVEVRINAFVPESLRPHTALGVLAPNCRIQYVGGKYNENSVTARTTTTGEMLVVADTVAPTVKALFASNADLSQAKSIAFRVGDNFSGITACQLYIDGDWAILDHSPSKGTATHTLMIPRTGSRHTVHLTLRDGCGNTTEWKGSFLR